MLIIVAAVLILKPFAPGREKLFLCDGDTGNVYAQYNAQVGTRFSVAFIHSVNKSEVKEIYKIKADGIYLEECLYSDFGAGVATETEGEETLTLQKDGKMLLSGIDRKMDNLSYIVGTVSDHILEINGEEISLRDLCGKNATVRFEYRK